MPMIRTISQTMEYLKTNDPNTAISEHAIRMLLKQGKLRHHKAGNRYLIDVNYLLDYLKNPPAEVENNVVSLEKFKKTEGKC